MRPGKSFFQKKALWAGVLTLSLFTCAVLAVFKSTPALGNVLGIWGWRFLAAAVASFSFGMLVKKAVFKSIFFSIFAALFAVAIGEGYLRSIRPENPVGAVRDAGPAADGIHFVKDQRELARRIAERGEKVTGVLLPYSMDTFHHADPVLGYRSIPREASIASIKMDGDKVIYDVLYTNLPSGWRITPQHPDAEEALVFFGCSFTYGEGLNDKQTYPYKAGEMLGDNYQVYNFGFHGYGSHQMLAMIENGYLDPIVAKHKRVRLFYLTYHFHDLRAAGKSEWDQDGPCYIMEGDDVVHKGTFREYAARKGDEGMQVLERLGENQRMRELHLAIIRKADKVGRRQYGAPLTVITGEGAFYAGRLRSEGMDVIDLTRLHGPEYEIPGDGHPNDKATTIIADAIVDHIKGEPVKLP